MLNEFVGLSTRMFSWVPDKYPEIFKGLTLVLPKSGINFPIRNYASFICMSALIGYLLGLVFTLFLLFQMNISVFLLPMMIIFLPVMIGLMFFLVLYFYPYQKTLSRRTSIDTNLPFVIAHMGSIASSGIPPSAVFKLLANFKEYDALAEEMKKIVRNMEVFGMDPLSAMREVAKRTPSEKFKQTLLGFVSTIEGGGDLKVYLRIMGEQALFTWRIKREKYLQQLSAYAEFYTGLLIAAPLFLISLFSVMNMIEPNLGGFGILQLMRISIYAFIPVLNIAFLIFLNTTQVEI